MDLKKFCWIGAIVGSALGGYLPMLWGAGTLSLSGLLCSMFGGIAGIWAGYRIGQSIL
jgi:outer membrane lipoprotein SlyB